MPNSSNQLVLSLLSSLLTIYAEILYVSKNGSDSSHCGLTVDTACGTLYAATANVYDNSSEIFVYNGQNEDEINKYFILNETNIWHPCLPYPNGTILSITFNNQYIHKMNDWFMKGVCYDNNHHTIKYLNTYLFDTVIILNNLYIDNYNTDIIPFSIFNRYIRPNRYNRDIIDNLDTKFIFNNCVFVNISYSLNIPMISIVGYTVKYNLKNCTFKNINSTANLINTYFVLPYYTDNAFIMTDVSIVGATFHSAMFNFYAYVHFTDGLVYVDLSTQVNILFYNCKLSDIDTNPSIIYFANQVVYYLNISDTIFENIIHGSIMKTSDNHMCTAADIYMKDSIFSNAAVGVYMDKISISSSQISTQNSNGLLQFRQNYNVSITNMNVMYYYDISENCELTQFINESTVYLCNNPVSLIYNEGYVYFKENNSFNVTIINDNFMNNSTNITFYYKNYTYFIESYGSMYVNNLTIYNIVLGNAIFYGDGILQLSNVVIDTVTLDTNMLQPSTIIYQDGVTGNVLHITHSILKGGRYHIIHVYYTGSIYILNTTFKESMGILIAWGMNFSVFIKESKFYDIGCVYIPNNNCMWQSIYRTIVVTDPFYVTCGDVTLLHNIFVYYPLSGFVWFDGDNTADYNILVQNNLFMINNADKGTYDIQRDIDGLLII
eukprot:137975_1